MKIGTFAPGSGDPTNGIEVFDESVLDTPPIQVAPRVGFSWDVNGDGKTAVRGGFGVFPDRFNDDIVLQHVELPPLVNTPTRQLHDHPRAARDAAQPEPGAGRGRSIPTTSRSTPTTTASACSATSGGSWSATSPTSARRGGQLLQTRNLNAVPYGTNFLPSSIDPTTGGALPNGFLRPYRGYADILFSEFAGFSNYDALQMQVSRRYTAGLRFGVAYTFAKTQNVGIALAAQQQPDGEPVPRRRGSQLRRRRAAAQPRRQLLVPGAEPEQQMGQRRSPRSSSTTGRSRA